MGADASFEGGICISPEKFLTKNKSGRIPRPQMPLRKIKRPRTIVHDKELIKFFGKEILPDWFLQTFELEKNLSNCHTKYYRDGFSEQFAWCPVYYPDNCSMFNVFYTVVNMIDYCERLIQQFAPLPSEIENIIREVQDRFLMLAVHMEKKNCYKTDELLQPDPEVGYSAFEMYRPRQTLVFTEEELPDLFVHTFYVNYWEEELVPVFDKALDQLILDFLKKLIPGPCKSRSFTSIISDVWLNKSKKKSKRKLQESEIAQFFDINLRLLFASLLGVYKHSTKRACLLVRMKLYRYFCMDFPGTEDFSNWFMENDSLVRYCFREFLFYSVSRIPALQIYMEKRYYWSFLTSNTFDTMNHVRQHTNQYIGMANRYHPLITHNGRSLLSLYTVEMYNCCLNGDNLENLDYWQPGSAWYSGLQSVLNKANGVRLNYANRSQDKNFVEKVIDHILYIDCKDENQGIEIKDPVNDCGYVFNKKEEDKLEDYVYSITKFDNYNYTYDWLIAFYKVSESSVQKLKNAEQLAIHETNRSNLKKILTQIKRNKPYDYAVIRCLFFSFKKKYSIAFHPLPRFMLKQQINTEMKLYQTPPGERLSDNAGLYYLCTSCGDIKTFVLGNRKQKRKDLSVQKDGENWSEEKLKYDNKEENIRELSLYTRAIAMDTGTGDLYCYIKKHQDFQKRKYDYEEQPVDQVPLKISTKTKKNGSSSNTALNLIKRKKKQNQQKKRKKNDEEEEDNQPDDPASEEDIDKKNNNSNQLKNRYLSSRCKSRPLVQFSALGQIITTEATGPCFKCPYCGTFSTYERKNIRDSQGYISCGCKQVDFKWSFKCELCDSTIIDKIYIRWIYDDQNEQKSIRPCTICTKHKLRAIKKYKAIISLSQLKQMIL